MSDLFATEEVGKCDGVIEVAANALGIVLTGKGAKGIPSLAAQNAAGSREVVDDLAEPFADEGEGKCFCRADSKLGELIKLGVIQFILSSGLGGVSDERLTKGLIGVEAGEEGLGFF